MSVSSVDPNSSVLRRLEGAPLPASVSMRAVEWLIALQAADANETTHAACRRWRAEHPDHERAWQHIETFGLQLRGLNSPLVRGALTRGKNNGRTRRQAIKALSLAFLAGGGAWLGRDSLLSGWQNWQSDYQTVAGDRLGITLADATHIDLDTGSAIDVQFDDTHRLVRLLRGQILVATAPDPALKVGRPARPFIVQTDQGRLRALGTRYSVRQFAASSQVSVFEGAVEVRPNFYSGSPYVLHAGEQTSFTREAIGMTRPVEASHASWSMGMLVAQDMSLSDFIAELARYVPGRLACDPDVGNLKVSGVYPLDDPDRVLDMLRRTQPIEVDRLTRYWMTVRRRSV